MPNIFSCELARIMCITGFKAILSKLQKIQSKLVMGLLIFCCCRAFGACEVEAKYLSGKYAQLSVQLYEHFQIKLGIATNSNILILVFRQICLFLDYLLDAVYDEKSKNKRCLYVSANQHTFDGTVANIKNFKGLVNATKSRETLKNNSLNSRCKERPTQDLHSAGMDDGTADSSVYARFVSSRRRPTNNAGEYAK